MGYSRKNKNFSPLPFPSPAPTRRLERMPSSLGDACARSAGTYIEQSSGLCNGRAAFFGHRVWVSTFGFTIGSVAGALGPIPGRPGRRSEPGDFDHDGHSDILWQNASGQAAVWDMNRN